MRLWQKVFLLTLSLSLLAIHAVSYTLLVRNHMMSLAAAREEVKNSCEYMIREVKNGIREENGKTGKILMTEQELQKYLTDVIHKQKDEKREAEFVTIENPSILDFIAKNPKSQVQLTENKGGHTIRMDTAVLLEGRPYRVSVIYNVSDLFDSFREDINFLQKVGTLAAVGIAGILLAVILWLTYPLKTVTLATEKIAGGAYQERVPEKGHGEFAELAKHMNLMAERIEEKIMCTLQLAEERNTFIANMTHELKTPLTSILGFADVLKIKNKVTEEERTEYAGIITSEAKRLQLLSSKLMELVSIRETELQLREAETEAVLLNVLEAFSVVCRQRDMTISCVSEPCMIRMDETLFSSLLYNVLENAWKASKPGDKIEVQLNTEGKSAVLRIRDHGIGIPKDQLNRVTEPFYMVDKARSRKAGGAGIGLALCREITKNHHGTFEIQSETGQGTCVTLAFPLVGKEEDLL